MPGADSGVRTSRIQRRAVELRLQAEGLLPRQTRGLPMHHPGGRGAAGGLAQMQCGQKGSLARHNCFREPSDHAKNHPTSDLQESLS